MAQNRYNGDLDPVDILRLEHTLGKESAATIRLLLMEEIIRQLRVTVSQEQIRNWLVDIHTVGTFRPKSVTQIDSTIRDVYIRYIKAYIADLVSEINPKPTQVEQINTILSSDTVNRRELKRHVLELYSRINLSLQTT